MEIPFVREPEQSRGPGHMARSLGLGRANDAVIPSAREYSHARGVGHQDATFAGTLFAAKTLVAVSFLREFHAAM